MRPRCEFGNDTAKTLMDRCLTGECRTEDAGSTSDDGGGRFIACRFNRQKCRVRFLFSVTDLTAGYSGRLTGWRLLGSDELLLFRRDNVVLNISRCLTIGL
jgi:hypothetical protein